MTVEWPQDVNSAEVEACLQALPARPLRALAVLCDAAGHILATSTRPPLRDVLAAALGRRIGLAIQLFSGKSGQA